MNNEDPEIDPDEQWRKPHRWPWVVGGASVVLIVIGLFLFSPPPEATPAAIRLVEEGYVVLWRDSFDQFEAADRLMQAALVESPTAALTLAAYAELELRWAEALRDGKDARFAPPDYDVHLSRGEGAARKAERTEPELRATRRALAQWYRLQSPPDVARARALFAEESEPLDATVHYELGVTAMLPPVEPARAILQLDRAIMLEPRMLRARFELARAYLALPKPDTHKAVAQLDALLRDNPQHRRATALLASLVRPSPIEDQ